MQDRSFADCSIVSCGSVRMELNALKAEGFLDAGKLYFTTPGLHEIPRELEKQSAKQMARAGEASHVLTVFYRDGCFVDSIGYFCGIETVTAEQGIPACRVKAHNCIYMLVSEEERDTTAAGRRVNWPIPGWTECRKDVFLEWDIGKSNETFPGNELAILLDPIAYHERLATEDPKSCWISPTGWVKTWSRTP